MKKVFFVLTVGVCFIDRLHADPKGIKDYDLVTKKYQQYYIPAEVIQKVFDKKTVYRRTNVYTRAPIFIVTRFFEDPIYGVSKANEMTKENLVVQLIENPYDPSKKCYSGTDGNNTEAKVYPLVENPYKGSYAYFSEATYRKGARVRGYFILDIRMRQVEDVTELRAEAFFQLADPLVAALAFALRGNRTFDVWVNRLIDDTIEFLSYVGRKATEGHYQECKNLENTPWIPG